MSAGERRARGGTHFQSFVLMLSFQPASQDTSCLLITAFHLWPAGAAGGVASFPMLMITSSGWMRFWGRVSLAEKGHVCSAHLDQAHLGVLAAPAEQARRLHAEVAHLEVRVGERLFRQTCEALGMPSQLFRRWCRWCTAAPPHPCPA